MRLGDAGRRFERPIVIAKRTAASVLCAWVLMSAPLMHLDAHAALAKTPVTRSILTPLRRLGLSQNWKMFAPPGKRPASLGLSLQFEDGWTRVVPLIDLFEGDGSVRLWSKRGESRMHSFLRANWKHDRPGGEMTPARRLFFESLGRFFCTGQGALPGLLQARFYLVQQRVEPFYPEHNSSYIKQPSSELPIYTLDCGDLS